jgi:hypothetical protein
MQSACLRIWSCSSGVEHALDKRGAVGSRPTGTTRLRMLGSGASAVKATSLRAKH